MKKRQALQVFVDFVDYFVIFHLKQCSNPSTGGRGSSPACGLFPVCRSFPPLTTFSALSTVLAAVKLKAQKLVKMTS